MSDVMPKAPAEMGGRIPPSAIGRRFVQVLAEVVAFCAILFAAAGTVRWWNAWAFGGLFLALVMANAIYVLPRNPEIVAARASRHPGTRSYDKILMCAYLGCYLGLFLVAGLDAERFGWAPLGWPWAVAGGIGLAIGTVPIGAAMAVNRHLEPTGRIQSDRGHAVVSTGPYALVRHPMYVGMLVQLPATALLVGSAWALLPALACAITMVVRTGLEDGMLRRELPGYAEYALITRYRLLPGIW